MKCLNKTGMRNNRSAWPQVDADFLRYMIDRHGAPQVDPKHASEVSISKCTI